MKHDVFWIGMGTFVFGLTGVFFGLLDGISACVLGLIGVGAGIVMR
jgi:hypothetical protein